MIVGSILSSYDILTPTVVYDISPLSIFFIILYARLLKADYTFLYYFVVIYTNFKFSFFANNYPYYVDTCLYDYKSVLLPTSNTYIAALPFAFTYYNHYCKC